MEEEEGGHGRPHHRFQERPQLFRVRSLPQEPGVRALRHWACARPSAHARSKEEVLDACKVGDQSCRQNRNGWMRGSGDQVPRGAEPQHPPLDSLHQCHLIRRGRDVHTGLGRVRRLAGAVSTVVVLHLDGMAQTQRPEEQLLPLLHTAQSYWSTVRGAGPGGRQGSSSAVSQVWGAHSQAHMHVSA